MCTDEVVGDLPRYKKPRIARFTLTSAGPTQRPKCWKCKLKTPCHLADHSTTTDDDHCCHYSMLQSVTRCARLSHLSPKCTERAFGAVSRTSQVRFRGTRGLWLRSVLVPQQPSLRAGHSHPASCSPPACKSKKLPAAKGSPPLASSGYLSAWHLHGQEQ